MKTVSRPSRQGCLFLFLVCAAPVIWGGRAEDVAQAQPRDPIKVTRIYTGADGGSYAEELELALAPGSSGDVSQMFKVTGVQFRRQPPNYFQDWHPAPRRQYVVTLAGNAEIELSGGRKVSQYPGHILLAEDVTGVGHISRGTGKADRVSMFLTIDEQPARK